MSLPQRLPLPKLPPKALPPGRPAAPSPVMATAQQQTAMAPVAPQPAHPAPGVVPAPTPASATPIAQRPSVIPVIDISGLMPSMLAMMEAIKIYEDLLVEENAMLRAGDSNGVAALLDRKLNATRLYQERQRTVLGDGEATRALTPEQRGQVIAMVRSLEELAKENTILLKANMSAVEQLFEVINNAARKMRKREVAYSQAGVIRDCYQAQNASLAYNHTI